MSGCFANHLYPEPWFGVGDLYPFGVLTARWCELMAPAFRNQIPYFRYWQLDDEGSAFGIQRSYDLIVSAQAGNSQHVTALRFFNLQGVKEFS